jgi:hypothetical protein
MLLASTPWGPTVELASGSRGRPRGRFSAVDAMYAPVVSRLATSTIEGDLPRSRSALGKNGRPQR